MQLLQHPLNGYYVLFTFAFDIDEDVIKIHNHKNFELLCQKLINIALERGRYIGQSKRYHLVLEIAIAGPEGGFPFMAFSNLHLMIGISQIELDKTLSSI